MDKGFLATGGGYGKLYLKDSVIKDFPQIIYLWYPIEDCYIERNIFIRSREISVGHSDSVKVYITNNVFYQNPLSAIVNWAAYDTSETIVRLNSFLNTAGTAVGLQYSDSGMSAINNYWGTTDIPTIESMIYDRNDYLGITSYIDYLPILTTADPNTPDPTPYLD